MSYFIEPDPRKPLGGYALLRLPDGAATSTTLLVEDLYDGQGLGPEGWRRGPPAALGPFDIERDEQGPFIRLGPDLVAHMEPLKPLRLATPEAKGGVEDINWPDTVSPPPRRRRGNGRGPMASGEEPLSNDDGKEQAIGVVKGGQRSTEAPEEGPVGIVKPSPGHSDDVSKADQHGGADGVAVTDGMGQRGEGEAGNNGESGQAPGEPNDPAPPGPGEDEDGEGRGLSLVRGLAAAAVVVLIFGGLGYIFFPFGLPVEDPFVENPIEPTETAQPADPPQQDLAAFTCDASAVEQALETDLKALFTRCVEEGQGDGFSRSLRSLANSDNPPALLHYARCYDPTVEAEPCEGGADMGNAIDFYKRAVGAGLEAASADLDNLCEEMRQSPDSGTRAIAQFSCN